MKSGAHFLGNAAKLLVVALVIVAGIYFFQQFMTGPFVIGTDRTAVITEIRSLQRLETANFTMEKIIDAQTSGSALQNFFFGDRLLLIAHARVIAGVDFEQLSDQDIVVNGSSIRLTLPESQIFIADLDETKTQVYDRRQGILTKGETQLESEARRAAETTMRQAACEGGILVTAATNAKQQLEHVLKALQFEKIEIVSRVGSC